ncbi:phosphopentomutase [Companilactobacillus sp. RD055328]|uniref:phosphopentomutase n=1 Tax=Companilactobacillus sp. RD055328 TaxID=2916634 RepID=UPI001FC8D51C|nr:phosphopentomutase [Companilactobacillus sp. RD055328]GKQ42437.1 phosphopentomutase [Companilactobacillus sp. RD055328]
MAYNRVFTIVMDSVGIGECPDSVKYHDDGADTLGHVAKYYDDNFKIPNLTKLGLGNIRKDNPLTGIEIMNPALGYFGKMQEVSVGKDSMDGHFEMMGLPVKEELGFFPNGFSQELIKKIEKFSNRKVIVNKPYSGTEVIRDYGEQQLASGDLIVYTSGDSVLQIAAHEQKIELNELYRICEYVRSITIDKPYRIGRIIARPYVGTDTNNFIRTANRHDYALQPTSKTDLDILSEAGLDVLAVGKINDIFSGNGITSEVHTISNEDGMNKTIENQKQDFHGFSFTNLVDFDAMYGHRRDLEGFGQAVIKFDEQLGQFLDEMNPDDLLIVTADHGNDPGFRGTDHTREYVPLLVYSPSMKESGSLGIRSTFSDLGATILDNFGLNNNVGTSFLSQLN